MSSCPDHHKKALKNIVYLKKLAPKTFKAEKSLMINCSNPLFLETSRFRVRSGNVLPQGPIGSFVEKPGLELVTGSKPGPLILPPCFLGNTLTHRSNI